MGVVVNFLRIDPVEARAVLAAPDSIAQFLGRDFPVGKRIDIDKAWHTIHYLLTGEIGPAPAPLGDVVFGGTPIGEVDVGYGPARYLTVGQVAAIAQGLAGFTGEMLWSRAKGDMSAYVAMYPEWMPNDEEKDYVLFHYKALVSFYSQAARSGEAVIVFAN